MKTVRVINAARGSVLCERCGVADELWTRMRGLSGRAALPQGEGLLIVPCPSIHMFGMKFALDVVFVTRENVVADLVENIAPGRIYVAKAKVDGAGKPHAALEMPAGTVAQSGTRIGDALRFEPVEESEESAEENKSSTRSAT